jgi:bisphosphoglycerate-independent phosphoglycerate mutase (AlkP superfamily)
MPNKPPINFSDYYDAVQGGDGSVVEMPHMNLVQRWIVGREMDRIVKAVGQRALTEQRNLIEARQQGAVVNDTLAYLGLYDNE